VGRGGEEGVCECRVWDGEGEGGRGGGEAIRRVMLGQARRLALGSRLSLRFESIDAKGPWGKAPCLPPSITPTLPPGPTNPVLPHLLAHPLERAARVQQIEHHDDRHRVDDAAC